MADDLADDPQSLLEDLDQLVRLGLVVIDVDPVEDAPHFTLTARGLDACTPLPLRQGPR